MMKRTREHGNLEAMVKRPTQYRGEKASKVRVRSTTHRSQQLMTYDDAVAYLKHLMTYDDAVAYLKNVKDTFKDNEAKYGQFLEVMKDIRAQKIDTAEVICRIKYLFMGHRELILGFNSFLPEGYEIILPANERPVVKKQPVEIDEGIAYVNKIKARFKTDDRVYKSFVHIMQMYEKGRKNICEAYRDVATLFSHHADLVEEFTYFLPESTDSMTLVPTHGPAANSGSRAEEKILDSNVLRPKEPEKTLKKRKNVSVKVCPLTEPEKTLKRKKVSGYYVERDRGVRVGVVDREPSELEKEQRKRIEKEKKDESTRSERDKSDKGKRFRILDALQRLPHKRKSARGVDELIRKQLPGGKGGETLHGQSASPVLEEDNKLAKTSSLQKEPLAFDKAIGKLSNLDTYRKILKCLEMLQLRDRETYQECLNYLEAFSEDTIDCSELQKRIAEVLKKHPVLTEGFNDFFSRCEFRDPHLANKFASKTLDFGEIAMVMPKVDKEKEREREQKDGEAELQMEQEPERERGRDREIFPPQKDGPRQKVSSISEPGFSNWERCTPSYRLFSEDYPKSICTHRTELGRSVLNDDCVCVTALSEDYSSKYMSKSQYEERLFQLEDDHFRLDMLVETTAATARRVMEMVDASQNPDQVSAFVMDERLSAINLRCIESIYGNHGLDVIDLVRNSSNVLPVIASRLRQKLNEWKRCRTELEKVWKIFHKSLEQRGFSFKQQDKKSLDTKSLIAEMRDISKRREGPELKFEYSDPAVHDDVYQIIKYSSEEVCSTPEISQKITRIWNKVFEPMFGVPPRSQGLEDRENWNSVNGGDVATGNGHGYEFEYTVAPKTSFEAEGDDTHNSGERDRTSSVPSFGVSFSSCKPLAAIWSSVDLPVPVQNSSSVLYGNDDLYVIFRLHQTLYERMLSAKTNALAAEQKWKSTKDTSPPDLYSAFMRALYSLLDGSANHAEFEDECRTIIGTQSYILFTLDKLIFRLVKQLQGAVSDDTLIKLLNLHAYERSRGPGRFIDPICKNDDSIYRFEHKYNAKTCVIQLMGNFNDTHEVPANAMDFSLSTQSQ